MSWNGWPRALCALSLSAWSAIANASAFDDYVLADSLTLPGGAVGPFEVLADGRIITLDGAVVYVESSPGSRVFSSVATLPAADLNDFGASFLKVSPNGTLIAVGNGGGASFGHYEVGVFDWPGLTGEWFEVDNFDAAWADDTNLAIAAGGFSAGIVTLLDITSSDPMNPTNPTVIAGIGGASGGVAFDAVGNLYTGNGFTDAGPSGTGTVKVFAHADWTSAVTMATPIDFESGGTLVIDILSAASLGFDGKGDLFVGGGDFNSGDADFAALVRGSAVANAVAGMGAVDANNPSLVRRLDPNSAGNSDFYSVSYNPATAELYVRDFGAASVYEYAVPPPTVPTISHWGAVCLSLLLVIGGTVVFRESSRAAVLSGGEAHQ